MKRSDSGTLLAQDAPALRSPLGESLSELGPQYCRSGLGLDLGSAAVNEQLDSSLRLSDLERVRHARES
jgi:hypothetical protein